MNTAATLQVTTPSEREILMTRVFDAPRHLVFEAYTEPELVKRWLGVHNGWSLDVCEIDLRVGGTYRYVWRKAGGHEMGMRGVYLEVEPPARIVATEAFEQPWYPGEAVGTVVLTEQDGRTTLNLSVLYESREIRDAVLQSPMEEGVATGFDKLAEIVASLEAQR